jgi:hypothetical protein
VYGVVSGKMMEIFIIPVNKWQIFLRKLITPIFTLPLSKMAVTIATSLFMVTQIFGNGYLLKNENLFRIREKIITINLEKSNGKSAENNDELFELNKDLNGLSQYSEQIDLETQLSKAGEVETPIN